MTYDRTGADLGARSRKSGGSGLFAARLGDSRLRAAGIALAVAGLVMVIFSFFPWASASDDDLSISVTGMGAVSLDISAERAQALGGATKATADLDEHSKSPGLVTAALGVLLLASAVMLLINRYPGIGALAGTVLALIAVFISLEYLFAPGSAVLEGTGDAGIGYAAAGLWLVTLGACVAAAVSAYSTVTVLGSTPPPVVDRSPATAAKPVRRQPYAGAPRPNQRAFHSDSTPFPPIRRSTSTAGPDRGLPPLRRNTPPAPRHRASDSE
ncbi:hypothetical protein [Nocardia sp. 348MFTsu5.1]|uniref:hypothetical protein n=1 Tax=Nocardia sp. 348MFTsu5.1 TaxID=1172185 RepID=UPI0012DC20C6|nr:hypothetical protein [Nocardia sp. 348MFTsu5.1]